MNEEKKPDDNYNTAVNTGVCDHFWASSIKAGEPFSVRICQLCHGVDWDHLRSQVESENSLISEYKRIEQRHLDIIQHDLLDASERLYYLGRFQGNTQSRRDLMKDLNRTLDEIIDRLPRYAEMDKNYKRDERQ